MALPPERLLERMVRRERLKIPWPEGPSGFYYPWPKVAVDDPNVYNDDERGIDVFPLGGTEPTLYVRVGLEFGQNGMWLKRGYNLRIGVGEAICVVDPPIKRLPCEYKTYGMCGEPVVLRVEIG